MQYDQYAYQWNIYGLPRYGTDLTGCTIRELPLLPIIYEQPQPNLHTTTAASFLEEAATTMAGEPDPIQNKLTLSSDRIDLLLKLIEQQDKVKQTNLQSLYNDLFTLDRMQQDRPFPMNYARDQTWMKVMEGKLRIYDSIRREMKDTAKAQTMIAKDLVDALLQHKRERQKEQMLTLDTFLDDSHPEDTGHD